MESGRVCHHCGSTNGSDANRRASCGTAIETVAESGGGFVDDDPGLATSTPIIELNWIGSSAGLRPNWLAACFARTVSRAN
jgi:hypothetical protein